MTTAITMADVKKHKKKNSAWVVIHNDVLDVTTFLNEHPGGVETLMDVAGGDGTQAFEDVGHSKAARELLEKYKIGSLPPSERSRFIENCGAWKWLLLALAGAIVMGVVYKKYVS